MRIFVLLAHDPATGAATVPVGALGIAGTDHHISWMPYQPAGDRWRERVASTTVPLTEAVDAWAEMADGITWDLSSFETRGAIAGLTAAVEAVLDDLLAHGAR
jgi:hypothetical protein